MACFARGYLRCFFVFAYALGLWSATVGKAWAQDYGWKLKTTVGAELSYVTNAFNLSTASIDRMEAALPEDQVSGRYKDMDSVEDLILTPRVKFALKGHGLGGRDLQIKPDVTYHLYLQNSKKSYLELEVDFEHEVWTDGVLLLVLGYKPDVHKKNYLANATDLTGGVTADERVYKPATYDDTSVDITYRHRLWKRGKGQAGMKLVSVFGEVGLGVQNREFADPFENRNEDSVIADAELGFKFDNQVELSVEYVLERVKAPAGSEVLILDEPRFGVDFNSDGDALDNNIRSVQKVDRTYLDHTIGVKARVKITKDWAGEGRYDYRIQDYESTERFDVTHAGREDTRHRFGVGLKRDFAPKWTLGLELELTSEEAGFVGVTNVDPEEVKTYDNTLFAISLSYSL